MRIALIGAGNLATHMGRALHKAGHTICQVYSRTQNSADTLAMELGCEGVCRTEDVTRDVRIYIVALKDSALEELMPHLLEGRESALWIHTAGSIPMDVWQAHGIRHYGVVYPMQTFSKSHTVDFQQIPIFLEASSRREMDILKDLASSISQKIYEASSEQRRILHLSAVFACNFTNAMYTASARLLEAHGLAFDAMLPLIDETARKVHTIPPCEAQTGPAVRYDRNVMEKHLDMLHDYPMYKELYQLTSQIIHQSQEKERKKKTS